MPRTPAGRRYDEGGQIIAMSDAELDELDQRRRKVRVVVGVVGVIVLVVAVLVGARFLSLGRAKASPLEQVTTFSRSEPGQVVPSVLESRLNDVSGFDWQLTSWGDGALGAQTGTLTQGRAALATQVHVPAQATALYSNLTSSDSVRRNGHLVVVAFPVPGAAQHFLVGPPTVFSNPAVERRRDTYWSGNLVYFYSPTEAVGDRTADLRRALPLIARCAKALGPCELPRALAEFDDWAPRA